MSSLEFFVCLLVNILFLNVGKSFAFVAGLRSIQYITIKHVLAAARDALCKVCELQILIYRLTCVNSISKRNGLVHMLHAMPVHPFDANICETLFGNGQTLDYENCRLYANQRSVAWPWLNMNSENCSLFAGLRWTQCIIIKRVLALATT